MKLSELAQLRKNLRHMPHKDVVKVCKILIDDKLSSTKVLREALKKKKSTKRDRRRNPNSKSERLRAIAKIWPQCVAEKYPKAFLHEVSGYVYARTVEFGTEKTIDKPVAHYVWFMYHGKWPYKGRLFKRLDGDKKNNVYTNLHPYDGVYE